MEGLGFQAASESISTYIDWLLRSHSDTFGPIWVRERVDFVFPKWSLTRLWWTQDHSVFDEKSDYAYGMGTWAES